ncbi:DUF4157 domain-containing protein [Cupriavidus oxalaticus]|uniref:hypothetical protein n=1 Tax=Cupriavidus oxalaticus TaxID=96344 RepID=UPI003F738228
MKLQRDPLAAVIETTRLIPARFDGYSIGPVVLLRPGASPGLLEHELEHVRQFWRSPLLHGLRYQLSRAYRLQCEVAAYREQLRVRGRHAAPTYARHLVEKYGLALEYRQALAMLTD